MIGDFVRFIGCHSCKLLGVVCLSLIGTVHPVGSQIIPDRTLPNNTGVITNGNLSVIEGGTRVGGNLFHSFLEFSLPTGNTAFFNNAADIQTIISRVTGGTPSNIDGLLSANGQGTSLFLINPNGILFGPNAQLNIGGSFIASTANSIRFADGSEFSATNPQAPPLLTINVPVGLQFGSNPGSITNRSQVTSPFPLPPGFQGSVGLQVLPGRTLALIGGDVSLENGSLTAFQGNILLGSVASPGLVRFMSTPTGLNLDYTGIQNFGSIELSGLASVNASGLGGGAILVTGGNVTLRDRSHLVSDTLGSLDGRGVHIQAAQFKIQDGAYVSSGTVGSGMGGGIAIRARDSVELNGTGFENFRRTYLDAALNGTINPLARGSGLFTGTVGAGRGGDIAIDTRELRLRDGAVILSPTVSPGTGGSIGIRASELMDVTSSGVFTTAFNQGDAGTLDIDTGKLIIRDGSVISTVTFGDGKGGDLSVRASESVEVSKTRADSPFGTNLSTTSIAGTGSAGNIEINTGSLLVAEGAAISATSGVSARDALIPVGGLGGNVTINASESVTVAGTSEDNYFRSLIVTATNGSADAGELRINTQRLIVRDGAGVGASTLGAGRGGEMVINASDSIEVIGKSIDGRSPTGIATASGDIFTTFFFPINPTGAAGNLSITTGQLSVRDGALVTVASLGAGDAGTLNVVADAIALDNQGSIDATTRSGQGGNINLQAREIKLDRRGRISANTGSGSEGNISLEARDIQLRRNSLISTNADNTRGGNISINTDTLVAVPQEDSDITANAQQGTGGRVSVTAQGIFGTEFRDRLTPESDITATSDLGPQSSGTVQIDIRGIDPSQGLVSLPENAIDPRQLITTSCEKNQDNSFIITGRGGLPLDPIRIITGRTLWRDVRPIENQRNQGDEQALTASPSSLPLTEATGWLRNAQGQVELIAHTSKASTQPFGYTPTNCSYQD
jgi:filamentous hemagglutinin family protein